MRKLFLSPFTACLSLYVDILAECICYMSHSSRLRTYYDISLTSECCICRTAGSVLGAGFQAFISDWDKVSATVFAAQMNSTNEAARFCLTHTHTPF